MDNIALKLFAKTNLQTSISYNQVALVDKTPTELNLKQAIKIYLEHNIECLIKEVNFDLIKAKERLHIIEGLLIALEDIDNVIDLIKKSENSTDARNKLINKYNLSEPQAKAILAMRLSSLAKLEKIELENEEKELMLCIAGYEELLSDKNKQKEEIRKRLKDLVSKYGDERRTELAQIELPKEDKEIEEVVPVDVVVVTTQSGLIKKVPISNFKIQRKGGKGVKSVDDTILSTIKTNTVDYMMFFTDKGKMYRTVVDNIPDGTNVTKGVPISNIVKLEPGEKIIAVTSLHRAKMPEYVIFVTKEGIVKKTYLKEYLGAKKNAGIAAIKLREGDSAAAILFQDDEELFITTRKGMCIRIASKDIGAIGRVATGIKGIKLKEGDEVVSALSIHKLDDYVGVFTTNGLGKKVKLNEFNVQGRGGTGVTLLKTGANPGEIAGVAMIDDEDNLLITGTSSSICISAKDIPIESRIALGNILIKNNRVTNVTKL